MPRVSKLGHQDAIHGGIDIGVIKHQHRRLPAEFKQQKISLVDFNEEAKYVVMPLLDFTKIEDVIKAANNTRYGLAAYVFTNDLTVSWRMAEGLEAGIIGINDPVPATPQCPFGGMKESGLGRELGHEGMEAYLETKYISLKLRD